MESEGGENFHQKNEEKMESSDDEKQKIDEFDDENANQKEDRDAFKVL